MSFLVSLITIILSIFTVYALFVQFVLAQPSISDPTLNVEPAVEGLSSPTSMAFLDNNNLLVLEKEGNVRLISKGILQEKPLLRIPVKNLAETGLLGISVMNGTEDSGADSDLANVFLYYSEGDPLRNRIYKYQWTGESFVNPDLILDLPAAPNHNGGKTVMGPDGYLYSVIGDADHYGQLQNFPYGPPPDDTGSIFRINPKDGSAAPNNPFANSNNNVLSKYYAYGIRNSFGIAFDPLTGNLWDTENGPASYDEINLVRPGFNSGSQTVMGPISVSGDTKEDLVNFPGSHYADPLFSWKDPVAPTDIEFFNSSKLGQRYTNNIFVGDINRGNLYFFEVNQNRDGIKLDNTQQESGLTDLMVDSTITKGGTYINESELAAITFGNGFGGITDIETGPDGFLYVLSFYNGVIYKISPRTNAAETGSIVHTQEKVLRLSVDEPFVVWFSMTGVDEDTGYIINWVTANNVTRANSYNASAADLVDFFDETKAKDGFVEAAISLPNGTMHIGDKYKACTLVPSLMYRVCDIGFNWPTNRPEMVSVTIPNPKLTTNPLHTQRVQPIDVSNFAVDFAIAGVDEDTGYIINWVTANNVTNVSIYNATDLDYKDNRPDGFIEAGVSLPNGTMHIGDKYKACTMVLKDGKTICNEGFNWPTGRLEYNTIILPQDKK